MNNRTSTLELKERVTRLGKSLSARLQGMIGAVPGAAVGPIRMVKELPGIDKVLASRVLKATTHRDPIASLKLMPGPTRCGA